MGTRGALGYYKAGEHKVTYNHFDSYPDGLGKDVIDYIERFSAKEIHEHFDKITMVKVNDVPDLEQQQRCEKAGTVDLGVSSGSLVEWYCLLRNAQGDLEAYARAGFMLDEWKFLYDSLFCEYAYIINLDYNTLEFYRGWQKSKPNGRYGRGMIDGSDKDLLSDKGNGYYPVGLVSTTPLEKVNMDNFNYMYKIEDE